VGSEISEEEERKALRAIFHFRDGNQRLKKKVRGINKLV